MTPTTMNDNLNFRMSSYDKKIIEMAAKFRGLKPNTYARQKLIEAAEKDLTEATQINALVLSQEDWKVFLELMEAPIKINRKLKKTIKDSQKFFR